MIHVRRNQVKTFDFDGLTIADYVPGLNTSGSVAEIVVGPGARHRTARSSRCDKFYYGLSGQVAFRVGDEAATVNPGDLLVIPNGEWFSYVNESGDAARLLLFHSPPFDLAAEEFKN